MAEPLLSVVIPCYNQAHLLGKCIDSVRALGHEEDIQIVVVNDGSPDDTAAVTKAYGDQIQYVEQANTGLPGARNAGIAAATGTYLMFLDADDEAHPELAQFVGEPRTADVYPGGYYIERAWSKESTRHTVGLPDGAVAIFNQNIGPPLCSLVRRTLAQEIGGFDGDFKSCEDWDFWIRVWKREPTVQALDIAYGKYMLHESSMVSAYDRMWKSARLIWKTHQYLSTFPSAWTRRKREDWFYTWTLSERVTKTYLTLHTRRSRVSFLLTLSKTSPQTTSRFVAGQLKRLLRR